MGSQEKELYNWKKMYLISALVHKTANIFIILFFKRTQIYNNIDKFDL
jgi:hypothetical protein